MGSLHVQPHTSLALFVRRKGSFLRALPLVLVRHPALEAASQLEHCGHSLIFPNTTISCLQAMTSLERTAPIVDRLREDLLEARAVLPDMSLAQAEQT